MYCTYCGTELVGGVCPRCQDKEDANARAKKPAVYVNVKEKPKREPNSAKIFSIICIATAILGLLGYNFPYLSIAAIVFAVLYKSKMGADCTLTKTGKILGIVGLVVNAIILVVATIVSAIAAVVTAVISFAWAIASIFGYIEELVNIIASYASYFM